MEKLKLILKIVWKYTENSLKIDIIQLKNYLILITRKLRTWFFFVAIVYELKLLEVEISTSLLIKVIMKM